MVVVGSGFGLWCICELGWVFEGIGCNMVMVFGLIEVVGLCVYVSLVEGFLLMWVD